MPKSFATICPLISPNLCNQLFPPGPEINFFLRRQLATNQNISVARSYVLVAKYIFASKHLFVSIKRSSGHFFAYNIAKATNKQRRSNGNLRKVNNMRVPCRSRHPFFFLFYFAWHGTLYKTVQVGSAPPLCLYQAPNIRGRDSFTLCVSCAFRPLLCGKCGKGKR